MTPHLLLLLLACTSDKPGTDTAPNIPTPVVASGPWRAFDGGPTQWCGVDMEGTVTCFGGDPASCDTPAENTGFDSEDVEVIAPLWHEDVGFEQPAYTEEGKVRAVTSGSGKGMVWGEICNSLDGDPGTGRLAMAAGHRASIGLGHVEVDPDGSVVGSWRSCSGVAGDLEAEDEYPPSKVETAPPWRPWSGPYYGCLTGTDGPTSCSGIGLGPWLVYDDVGKVVWEGWSMGAETFDDAPTHVAPGFMFQCLLDAKGLATCRWQGDGTWPIVEDRWAPPDLTPPDTAFVDIVAGPRHVCGQTIDGDIACWGDLTGLTAPGDGPYTDISPWCGLTPDGEIECWTEEPLADTPCARVCGEWGCQAP